MYATPSLNIDFLMNGGKGRGFVGEDITARHTLKDQVIEINQTGRGNSNIMNGDDDATLHNVRFQYDGHSGLMAGIDFTKYRSPSFQHFLEKRGEETLTDMNNNSRQNISQWALFANHTHTFATGWTLNYGVHGGYTSSKTYNDYLYNKGNGYELDPESLENNLQKEYTGNVFLEASKNLEIISLQPHL
ncbi:hypothetical protein [Parabacteroides gordonii]|uniref:hypothetical protein n=1 Tax=Parabacteroides gordonii TaxID=574930 RepID=UPI00241DEA5F|nr:hypothetical protein [Parabacteroides gordonii]